MKNFFSISILISIPLIVITWPLYGESYRPFSSWPAAENKIVGVKIVVAETKELSHQGFCNASPEEFRNIAIWFPKIEQGTVFVNTNPGYGYVNADLQVVFLDENWNVIKLSTLRKRTGTTIAPENTCSAIEGIPEIIKKIGFTAGRPSPVKIIKKSGKYFVVHNFEEYWKGK
ncbi:MAG: hypothetical protein N2115_02430 [bacterium]|nr:hypothetical protein [bacterium]